MVRGPLFALREPEDELVFFVNTPPPYMSFVGFDAIQAEETTFVGAGLPTPAELFDDVVVEPEEPQRPLIRASAPPPAPETFKRLCKEFRTPREGTHHEGDRGDRVAPSAPAER